MNNCWMELNNSSALHYFPQSKTISLKGVSLYWSVVKFTESIELYLHHEEFCRIWICVLSVGFASEQVPNNCNLFADYKCTGPIYLYICVYTQNLTLQINKCTGPIYLYVYILKILRAKWRIFKIYFFILWK